ncbi:hypothetical protein [Leuconostoc fallax]|uniref:Uncharacterized protein n=1 Tax=Leuconostoc fallax TaxID=1251 RepID=A0A4R5NAL8_9LACO|nr:hypothetical protein [Leuconostoc fallax]MBU7456434.1 hypothetical protein [Leuconostoc fallax]TDG69438.1 hypothetical protein C5L23_000900 [Leuconostoc fallax]
MDRLLEILIFAGIIAFQTFAGYIDNKYMGVILPVIFTGIVGFLAIAGQLSFSMRDVTMPILGLFTLLGIYASGKESKKKKIQKELDKMKAQDIIKG